MTINIQSFKDLRGTISAVNLNGSPVSGSPIRDVAEKITYNARSIDGGINNEIVGSVPCNRRFSKARIISASAGDMCDIRVDTATGKTCLYVYTERDDLYDCNLNPIETI